MTELDRIKEISLLIEEKSQMKKELSDQIFGLDRQKTYINTEIRLLEKELRLLQAQQCDSEIAQKVINKHSNAEYKGKANGKTDTYEGKIYAECSKCHCEMELFEGNTGIGSYVIGVCPKCETEISFTDSGKW